MLSKLSSIILRLIKSDNPILNETTIAFEKEFLLIIDFLTSSDRDPILKFIFLLSKLSEPSITTLDGLLSIFLVIENFLNNFYP